MVELLVVKPDHPQGSFETLGRRHTSTAADPRPDLRPVEVHDPAHPSAETAQQPGGLKHAVPQVAIEVRKCAMLLTMPQCAIEFAPLFVRELAYTHALSGLV